MSGLIWNSYESNDTLRAFNYFNNANQLYANAISFFNAKPTSVDSGNLTTLQISEDVVEIPPFTTFRNGTSVPNTAIAFEGYFCPTYTGDWTFTLGYNTSPSDDFAMMFLGLYSETPGSQISPSTTFNGISSVPSNTHPILYNIYWQTGGENPPATLRTTVSLIYGEYYPILIYYNRSTVGGYVLSLSYQLNGGEYITDFSGTIFQKKPTVVCFKEGSKILTDIGYRPIETLRKGDRIKTLKDGYKAIDMIGCRNIVHKCSQTRIKEQLYLCSPTQFPDVFEDLVITGCHSILVDDFKDEDEKNQVVEVNSGRIFMTDGKLRVPACVDARTSVYQTPGTYTIYHFALENEDYFMKYGIYANGLLVETCSQRYLKELSNMVLLEHA